MKYSLIIPVYNRPDEVDELLRSIAQQTYADFEVIIVEDGSTIPCLDITLQWQKQIPLHYYTKPNTGPGPTRNYAAQHSHGQYLIILDSDCILPPDYLKTIDNQLTQQPTDAFGGPDKAHPSFTPTQKAISYAMTSIFTTGGIRGGRKKIHQFHPRSFNMGIKADVYRQLGGFQPMRFGEDIDLSIRIYKNNHTCRLIPQAWVWHKRRTNLKKFFKQVHNSGIARINLYKRHPDSLKIIHTLPAAFTLCTAILLLTTLCGLIGSTWAFQQTHNYPLAFKWTDTTTHTQLLHNLTWMPLLPLIAFALLICTHATITFHNLKIGLIAVAASYVQLIGYGTGFLKAWWKRCILKQKEFTAFQKNFYK